MKKEKKAKGKGKTKGKAIIGIAMTAIMLASVFALMIGGIGAYSNGGAYNIIKSKSAYACGLSAESAVNDLEGV